MKAHGNKLLSKKSKKTLAYATALLTVKIPRTATDADGSGEKAAFEDAIDACPTLRRQNPIVVQLGERFIILRGAVEYGPVFGCHPSDLERHLDQVITAMQDLGKPLHDSAVFNFVRHEVKPAQIRELIATLESQLENEETPLAKLKEIDKTLTRLRQQFPEEAEPKVQAVITEVENTPIVVETANINVETE